MEEAQIILERHEQRLKILERDISDLKAVQSEIRTMNETLVMLANELKHTNEHLTTHERKLEELDAQPREKMNHIFVAIVAALSGCIITTIANFIFA